MVTNFSTKSTSTDIKPDFEKQATNQRKSSVSKAKAECIAAGGQWNEATQSCDLAGLGIGRVEDPFALKVPEVKPSPPPKANIPKGTVETFTSSETGRASGVTLPDGRDFLGLGPSDVASIAQGEADKAGRPVNSAPVGTAQSQLDMQVRNQQLMQMAQRGLLTPQELQSIQGANIDVGQALGAGVVGAIPGIIGGAVTGATVGALGGPVGAVGGAVLGGIGTFLNSIRGNIKGQTTGEFAADREALIKGERYLRSLITDTNQNPQNAPENIAMFYQTLNSIDAAHAKTYKDSQESLNRFLGKDGTQELSRFKTFDNTMRQYYISQFATALNSPNPSQVLITSEDLNSFIDEQ